MIVPMKHLTLLCVASEGEKALESLRDLGCVHLDLSSAASPELAAAKGELADAERAVRILDKAAREACPASAPEGADLFDSVRNADLVAAVLKADAERATLSDQADALRQTIRTYAPFGDFDPAFAASLRAAGVPVKLAQGPGQPPERKAFFEETLPDGWTEIPLPAERLSATRAKLAEAEAGIAGITASLAAASGRTSAITGRYPGLKDRVAFAAAQDVLATQGAVSYIEGWVPVDAVPRLRAKAVTKAWGLLVRDARADETPPTLIRPPKLFRPVAALFQGLGIAPGYTEADVSVPFMCYFSIFFAMLVGDGGYGAIILALTLWGWRKTKPKEGTRHRPAILRSWLTLLTVFSSATVVWGILSNTWFGASLPFARDWATVRWLGDPTYGHMMLLCFTIGVPRGVRLGGRAGVHVLRGQLDRRHLPGNPLAPLLGVRRLPGARVRVHGEAERAEDAGRGAGHAAAQRDERARRHHQLRAPLRGGPRLREGCGELQRHGDEPRPAAVAQDRADGADPSYRTWAQLRDGGTLDPRPRRAPQHAGVLQPQGRLLVGLRLLAVQEAVNGIDFWYGRGR